MHDLVKAKPFCHHILAIFLKNIIIPLHGMIIAYKTRIG